MALFDTPIDWKSTNWWRNRSAEERKFHAKVPPRLDHTDCAPSNNMIAAWVASYRPGSSLLLTGPTGSGKTYAAVEVLNTLLSTGKISGRFVDADDYIEMIKDTFDSHGDLPEMYSSPHLLKYIKGVWDVVVLDGLGQERRTDFAKHELGSLIRHRHDHNLTTVVTSTMGIRELLNVYGDRISAPLKDMKQVTLLGRQ